MTVDTSIMHIDYGKGLLYLLPIFEAEIRGFGARSGSARPVNPAAARFTTAIYFTHFPSDSYVYILTYKRYSVSDI